MTAVEAVERSADKAQGCAHQSIREARSLSIRRVRKCAPGRNGPFHRRSS